MILTLAAAAAASAMQPGSQVERDVRCVAAFAVVGDTLPDGDEGKTGLMLLTMYYIGKIDGEAPGIDLEAALRQVTGQPGYEQQLQADLQRCASEMEARGKKLQSVGNALQGK